ncbi:RNA polymerase sigma-70 factor [Flagellimonas hymeniacidonis]|uniref:RNA polymerase sigma-70 factor n=1 Tax=Flagellimonas hymeniacidonis TaxID=2603628 RepID=A0A5C8V607_9FLAO|nr:RNA polymerase sigma-70 factor [Flagellimonas hymeniacidonis]TXN36780.1 RNA polymerase sigma-70 factor [Flagellimonas hymeniacidonis]
MLKFHQHSVLVEHLKQGDEKAFAHLIQEYHQLLCTFAYNLSKDTGKSEDIVQNVFLKVWEQRSQLKAEYSLKSYLHKLTYNEFIDQTRKQKSMSSLEKKYVETLNNFLEQKDWDQINKVITVVKAEIETLPPKCKKVFTLSKQDGLTNIEISEHLKISVKAVESHMTKAFSILRKKMGDKIKTILFFVFSN